MEKYDLSKIKIMSAKDAADIRNSVHEKKQKELRERNIKDIADMINKAVKATEYKIELNTYSSLSFIIPILKIKGYKVEKIQGYQTYCISWNENLQNKDTCDSEFDIIPDALFAYTQTVENIKNQKDKAIYNIVHKINHKIQENKDSYQIDVKIDPQYYDHVSEIFQKNGYKTKLRKFPCPLGLYEPFYLIYINW
ncbi:Hypothetical protein PACV_47 [Pacmanvirus A23]|uniref:Hypothetical protein n=1 Tax=Pacmanvirus A23 TaxID=1932881 RepID=UPI000A095C11|nr:Hypothetical protein B9W72_gp047 [Pacmanvirus A23]SIP85764.1 Hypothetical protein PACV_47 [Pacmanvirus A23]